MTRMFVGAGIGFALGILALNFYGAYEGTTNGWSTRPDLGPGWRAGAVGALFMMAYFWPIVGGVGAMIGGLAGLGSALVQQRSKPKA